MTNEIDQLIKDIAIKNQISISKDDPVLILHTTNEMLLDKSKKMHAELIQNFQQELETALNQWDQQTKEKAEKILNASLQASKKAMNNIVQNSSSPTPLKSELSSVLHSLQYHATTLKHIRIMLFFNCLATALLTIAILWNSQ